MSNAQNYQGHSLTVGPLVTNLPLSELPATLHCNSALHCIKLGFRLPVAYMTIVRRGSQHREQADGPAFLQSLFEYAEDGVARLAPDGRVFWANSVLCSMLGYSRRNLIGKPFNALAPSEGHNHRQQLQRILNQKAGRRVEERLLDRRGNPHWVEIIAFPLHDKLSAAPCAAVVRDITESKLAQNSFATIFESAPLPMALVNAEGNLLLTNVRFETLFGYAHGKLNSKSLEVILPKFLSHDRLLLRKHDGNGATANGQTCEWIARRRNGNQIPVEIFWKRLPFQNYRWFVASVTNADVEEESEEKFEKAFHESPMPMTLTKLDDEQYVDVNRQYEQMTGYQREEIVGRTPLDIGLWLYPEQRRDLLQELRSMGHVREVECSFRMKDGSTRIALGSMTLIHTGGEQLVLSTALDITEQKRSLQELEQVTSRFRTIFEDAPVGMAVSTMAGKFIEVNNALCDFLGYSKGELLRMGMSSIAHSEDLAVTLDELRAMDDGEAQPGTQERRFVHKSGEMRWGDLHRSLVRDTRSGKLRYVVAQVVDTTERKKAEQALRETEERFRTIANSAPVLIWMSGADKMCTYFNQPWLDFTGRTMEAELGKGWAESVHPDDLAASLEQYRRAFEARVPFTLHYRLRRRDGEYRWIVDNGIPRYGPDGTFAGYIGSCIDETDRRAAENALRSVNANLVEAQEKERKRVARELHDDINQRIAMLAIELQQLEQNQTLGTSVRRKVARMFSQAIELSSAVQALSHQLHSSTLEHVGIAAAARSFCRTFAQNQKVKVEFTSKDVPANVQRDLALALYRALQEALHNAAKHSKVKRFEVAIYGKSGEIALEVRDQGVGFDPTIAMKREGLGLVSIQERILPFNGTLSIVSAPQQGTQLTVRIPVKDQG